jgi:hypothetical protein
MATLREFYQSITNGLAQMWASDAPMGPATPENRTVFVEGYRQALEDLKTTWQANELWNREVFCTDFLAHVGRIEGTLAQRLGLTEGATKTMTAGGGESSAGGVVGGSP